MVVVPAGTVSMGSRTEGGDALGSHDDERPQRRVAIPAAFAVSKYEITVAQFSDFVRATGHTVAAGCRTWVSGKVENRASATWRDPGFHQTDNHPVTCVTWFDAQAYVNWLRGKSGNHYRLLTEAEWEYASRGGARGTYSFGDSVEEICSAGNVADLDAAKALGEDPPVGCRSEIGTAISCGAASVAALSQRMDVRGATRVVPWEVVRCRDGVGDRTAAVGSFRPNGFGLYDTTGNVWEWVEDCYAPTYEGAASDGSAVIASPCGKRALRGGAWAMNTDGWRLADRDRDDPNVRYASVGFRIARSVASTDAFAVAKSAEPDPEHARLLRDKREWVREVERGDYFFWERFIQRVDNPREFPMPPEWYRPSELVIGEPSAPLPVRTAGSRRLSKTAQRRLRDYLMPRETGAFYVMHAGEIDFQMFDAATHPGSLLAIRSLTKLLPALLVGIAIEEGTIAGVDERVSTYLHEWKGDPRGEIRIRQLLRMTSGLEASPIRSDPNSKGLLLAEGSNVNAVALSFAKIREPDETWLLNNADTQLLGLIIERATGRRYADYLSERIWRPMGLNTATLNLDGKTGEARTFCCMRTQASDWLKLGYMMMHDGRWAGQQIVPAAWLSMLLEPVPGNPKAGSHVLLGWNPGEPKPAFPMPPYREPFRVPGVFFMAGGISIGLWMVPSHDLVIFRWGNDPPDWDTSAAPNMVLDGWRGRPASASTAEIQGKLK